MNRFIDNNNRTITAYDIQSYIPRLLKPIIDEYVFPEGSGIEAVYKHRWEYTEKELNNFVKQFIKLLNKRKKYRLAHILRLDTTIPMVEEKMYSWKGYPLGSVGKYDYCIIEPFMDNKYSIVGGIWNGLTMTKEYFEVIE